MNYAMDSRAKFFMWLCASLGVIKNWRAACRVLFAVILASSMLVSCVMCKLAASLPFSKLTREGCALWVVQLAWRVTLLCSPWISVHSTPRTRLNWVRYLRDEQESTKPSFVLSNHVSFLDTIVIVSSIPRSILWSTRCYMGAHLYKMPILGTICRALGHFPVHFKSGKDGQFSLDKHKMQHVEQDVGAHVEAGGILALFPEGQMNPEPSDGFQSFRYGAFKRALECDARLWSLVSINHEKCWPRKAQVGGYPARTGLDFQPIAPDGVQKLLEKLKCEDGEAKPDHVLLAEGVQRIMQAQHNDLQATLG